MAAAPPPPPVDPMHVPLRRRVGGIALAIVANLILLALLLGLTPLAQRPPPPDRGVTTFELSSDAGGEAARQAPVEQPREAPRVQATSREAARVKTPPPAPVEAEVPKPLPMILLTPEQFAGADIGRMPRGRSAGSGPATGTGDGAADGGGGGGEDKAIGTLPNGDKYYRAVLLRAPTDAELAPYWPKHSPSSGWGQALCKMRSTTQVEDCVERGESPQGSGFARMVRLSAWQFRIRPPRLGQRSVIGASVLITYEIRTIERTEQR